ISADPGSNGLVVRATAEDQARIAAMITQMDSAPLSQTPVQTIALTRADPVVLSQTLARIFGPLPGGRGPAALPSAIIEADRFAHLLMVRADKETFARIKDMATQIDNATPAPAAGIN